MSSSQTYIGLTRLPCSQVVAGVARWLNPHWRAAKVICLGFQGYPADDDWASTQPAPAASADRVRVLRVMCSRVRRGLYKSTDPPVGLRRWIAGVLPLCQNLSALHLRHVELKELPALPLLMHLILEDIICRPALVDSLKGLASLRTLRVSGFWGGRASTWDVRACTRLYRVYMSQYLAGGLVACGKDLCVPPACTIALELAESADTRSWLVHLGSRISDLHLHFIPYDVAIAHQTSMHAPELLRLRHVTLYEDFIGFNAGSLCLARLLGGLPQTVESLHLHYPILSSEQALIEVPARLRALRLKGVCDEDECRWGCICPPSQRTQDLTFGLHAGLERLCLVLWGARVGLQCLDAGAPAALRELSVQARGVDMDAQLAAEVAQRGRVLARCDVVDIIVWWHLIDAQVPTVQVVHIGQGPVHMEVPGLPGDRAVQRHWACTCGTCAECLGPEAFGGVVDACR